MKREVHGGNVLVAKHHSIVGQEQVVTVVKEGVDVQFCVEDIWPITNHCTWPRALGAARVSEVNSNTMTLPSFTRGTDQETLALNALVVDILRGMENVAQLSSTGQCELLTLSDFRDLLGHAAVPLNGRYPDNEVPIQKPFEGACHRCYPRLETAFAVRHQEREKLSWLPTERLEGRELLQLLHRSFQIFAQLETRGVPKSTRHSLAVSNSPAIRMATKSDDFADLRGDLIQLLSWKASKAAVEELELPAEVPLHESRSRMGLLIGSDMMQKRKLSFEKIGSSCLPKWEVC